MSTPEDTEPVIQPDLILAIGTDNLMAHAGPAAAVLKHVERMGSQAALHKQRPEYSVEFFSLSGRQVSLEEVKEIVDQGISAQPYVNDDLGRRVFYENQEALLNRIHEGLRVSQRYLDEHPEAGNQGPNVDPMTEVPRISGSYPEVLAQLAGLFSPLNAMAHRGNVFHNLWHSATGTS